jgi:hypothetical protein
MAGVLDGDGIQLFVALPGGADTPRREPPTPQQSWVGDAAASMKETSREHTVGLEWGVHTELEWVHTIGLK